MEELMANIYGSTGVWFLMGAALVFFMQAGFAMVEAGFTRAKNAGNIIMKNLMDFCIGTVVFVLLGGGLLLGQDALGGFLGLPTIGLFTDFETYDWFNFVFNLVFCATAATGLKDSAQRFSVKVHLNLLTLQAPASFIW